jgi:hypothetical protein
MRLFLPRLLYKVWCLSKSHAHTNNSKKSLFKKEKEKTEEKKRKQPCSPPHANIKISPYANVTLTFDFDFGLDHPVHGGYG